jgi:hypothetical protein
MNDLERAKEKLSAYRDNVDQITCFRGVPINMFDKEDLIAMLTMMSKNLDNTYSEHERQLNALKRK